MDIHCHNETADDHQDRRTDFGTSVRRRGGLPQDDATPAIPSHAAELRALEILTTTLVARMLAERTEEESLALKADLVRQAGYVSVLAPTDPDEALREAAAWQLMGLIAAASDTEADLRRRR